MLRELCISYKARVYARSGSKNEDSQGRVMEEPFHNCQFVFVQQRAAATPFHVP